MPFFLEPTASWRCVWSSPAVLVVPKRKLTKGTYASIVPGLINEINSRTYLAHKHILVPSHIVYSPILPKLTPSREHGAAGREIADEPECCQEKRLSFELISKKGGRDHVKLSKLIILTSGQGLRAPASVPQSWWPHLATLWWSSLHLEHSSVSLVAWACNLGNIVMVRAWTLTSFIGSLSLSKLWQHCDGPVYTFNTQVFHW